MTFSNLISIAGILCLLAIAWVFSTNRRQVSWRVVAGGILIQLFFALFVFVIPVGTKFFLFVNNLVLQVLDSASAGINFVFGPLALGPGATGPGGEKSIGFILAFQALPTIIFFAALMAMLYYLGIMNRIIRFFAYIFTRLLRISGAESLAASSNIFVGVESSLVIKPYLKKMTRSELCTVLTAGMATIASSMLAVYVILLKNSFPTIAGHLVSASIMNAPAAIVISKILYPESRTPETLGQHIQPEHQKENNLFESIINGANSGVKLVVGIVALLLAFLGIVSLVDKILVLAGNNLNHLMGIHIDWTLKGLLGYIFYPFTIIIGIPIKDAGAIARIIGERLIVTEVTSYQDLAALLSSGAQLTPRTVVMTTYVLAGFAHVASLAIFVGGFSALVPERMRDLAQLGFRALLGATLACLLTGSIAGLFFINGSILFG